MRDILVISNNTQYKYSDIQELNHGCEKMYCDNFTDGIGCYKRLRFNCINIIDNIFEYSCECMCGKVYNIIIDNGSQNWYENFYKV